MNRIITKIEAQKNDKNRVSIFINKNFEFGIYLKTLMKFDLVVGMEINSEFEEEIKIADEYNKCFNKALNFISYQERTTGEVRKKMRELEYLNETIDLVIEEIEKLNFLDDDDYAKRYIEFKIEKMGKFKILMKLKDKGINESIINKYLDSYTSENQYKGAYKLAKKKNDSYGEISREKRYNRLAGLLNRNGYSYDIVRKILEEILGED